VAADEPEPRPTDGSFEQPPSTIQRAIAWLTDDQTNTRQVIEQRDGPIVPGQLLESARFDAHVESLLPGATDQTTALIHAQAEWLIRRMPPEHSPPSLDSAQQAGRAWGVLIAADTMVLPDQDVLTEVSRRTGISTRAADEIQAKARSVSAAYNRAELLRPYDNAKDEALIRDWNQLAACGPELPEAAQRAQDVLELLTARVAGFHDYGWMDATAQHAAQVYDSVVRAQPLLAPVAELIPGRDQPDTAAQQARLVELDQAGLLATAATAAARARAVQEWADHDGPSEPDRTRRVEAAAVGMRTLVQLNKTLAALDPTQRQSAFTSLDPKHVARVVEAIGRLSAEVRSAFRTVDRHPAAPTDKPAPQHHQHPPTTGPNPGGGTPRAAP
jgi:hypothetical protein